MKGNVQILINTAATGTLDLTERAESYRFGTLQPGGLWQAQVATLAPERDLWTLFDANPPGTLEFWVQGEVVWSGALSALTLEANKLSISAEGPALRLKDDEIWRAFADSEYARWKPEDSDKFDRDNNNRLYAAMKSGVLYAATDEAVIAWPDAPALVDLVVRLTAHVEVTIGSGQCEVGFRSGVTPIWSATVKAGSVYANPADYTIDISDPTKPSLIATIGGAITDGEALLVTYLHDRQGGETFQANLDIGVELKLTPAPGTVEVWNEFSSVQYHTPGDYTMDEPLNKLTILGGGVIADGQPLAVKYSIRESATDEKVNANLGVWAKLAYVPIVGSETVRADDAPAISYDVDETLSGTGLDFYLKSLTPYGACSASATQVCVRTIDPSTNDAILSTVLAASGIALADVRASGLTVEQAVYEGRPGTDVMKDMAFLGDGNESWVCAIYPAGAEFRPWPALPDWLIERSDLAAWSIQRDRANVINAVRAVLPDGWLGAWVEDAASIARYGRREKTLSVPQTSQAEATAWARIYLAERASVLSSLRLEANALIRKPDNSLWPVVMIRAGDVIALRDVIPLQDLLIRVAETQYTGATMQITPLGASSRLEVILARRNAQQVRGVIG